MTAESGRFTLEMLHNAMRMVENAPSPEPSQWVLHPREAAWVKNPIGKPPTWQAVMVAAEIGTITSGHPYYDMLMDAVGQALEAE